MESEASTANPAMPPAPILLYSTNTWLAYTVSEKYYNRVHYVWCTPLFGDPQSQASRGRDVLPPSSNPYEIYRRLHEEVRSSDQHSAKIKENKTGILRGAASKREEGVITEQQQREIASIVELAEFRDFTPLLYLIPYERVSALLREVPISEKAHPLSKEYIIEQLPREHFDVVELVSIGS